MWRRVRNRCGNRYLSKGITIESEVADTKGSTATMVSWARLDQQLPLASTCCVNKVVGSVAMAIADIFQNNGISVGRNLAKILKLFEKIYEEKG